MVIITESRSQVGDSVTVVFIWILSPLPNKPAPTLHAAETVRIISTLCFDFHVNSGLNRLISGKKTDDYSLLMLHRELKMLNVDSF
jgi:hypothetical protein